MQLGESKNKKSPCCWHKNINRHEPITRLVLVFAKYSIDSVHWSNVGDPTAIDQIIMAWAVTNGYIVFTHDLDFGILLATTQANAPSVIQVRTQDILPATLENIVIPVMRQFESELERGALITIDPSRSRIRILPIIT